MRTRWSTLLTVCVGTFMLLLDISVVMVALPVIQHAIGTSFTELQWVVDAYALVLAAALLTAGSLADRFGHRRLYLVGLAIFTSASLVCGVSSSALMLILVRGVQGLGGAIMFATALALLGDRYRGKERKLAFAIWGATTGLAVALGPLVGGALISAGSWRWIFWINVPVGAVAIALALRGVTETERSAHGRIDWGGFITFSAALGGLVYGLIRGTPDGWGSAGVLTAFAVAVTAMAAFVVIEQRVREPMFDLALLGNRTFAGGSLAAFVVNGTLPALILYLVIYLQDVLGYSPFATGLRLLVMSGGIVLGGAISGRVSQRLAAPVLLGVGLALMGAGALLLREVTATSGWTALISGLAVGGLGLGLVNPTLAAVAVDVVGPGRAGVGSGINTTFRQLGVATGIAGLGSIFLHRVTTASGKALSHVPQLSSGAAHHISAALTSGQGMHALEQLPPVVRAQAGHAARHAFVSGLDGIFLVAGMVALVGAATVALLVRSRDLRRGSSAAVAGSDRSRQVALNHRTDQLPQLGSVGRG
jgi:EmrB/QacA subfamily drug resistance transporter